MLRQATAKTPPRFSAPKRWATGVVACDGQPLVEAQDAWRRFVEGGRHGISAAVVVQPGGGVGQRVSVSWVDGHKSEFSTKWLRDHAADAFNSHTKQRQVGEE
ncbi:unnamed protein product [Ectocarpus sp. CCAP 1310/34]|nr:unnamed protein product [Ectocarpus sp. CCAP 1310/34]